MMTITSPVVVVLILQTKTLVGLHLVANVKEKLKKSISEKKPWNL
jgi:hypothetical protein